MSPTMTITEPIAIDVPGTAASPAAGTIAVLYENGAWMENLFSALDARGLRHERIDLADAAFSLDAGGDYSLVINRVSPSADLRGHGSALGLTRGWLEMLERSGTRVINGARSFGIETSKIAQYQLIRDLGLALPRTVAFNRRGAREPARRRLPQQ